MGSARRLSSREALLQRVPALPSWLARLSGLDDGLRRDLGRHVRQLRTAQDLTLAALAEQVGVSPSALSQIERGKSEPSLGTLWRLGGVLQASLFDFFAHDRPAPVDVTHASERTVVEFDRLEFDLLLDQLLDVGDEPRILA